MIAACKTNNVTLGIAYYRRFYPVVARIKEIIQEGGIGKPVVAQVNAFERFNPDPSHPRYWLIKKERSGGGPMFDFGCHRVEVLLNLLGPIKETRGRNWNALFDREVEDSSAALFEFESGARGLLTVTHAAIEPQDTLDIFGSDGSVHVRVLNEGTLEVRTSDGVRRESHPTRENTHQPLIDDFSRAVLEGRVPAVTGDVGLEVARVIEDIYENPRGTGGPRA
jgi:predicted dehydrogenase